MTAGHIRLAATTDLECLRRIALEMKAQHELEYFERCLEEQRAGNRVIFIAENSGRPIGYVQMVWQPLYQPFRKLGIPEIQDLNVIPDMRRQGTGAQLVDFCEDMARVNKKTAVGIGVGLHARYGAAQRLYVRKGYLPDGAGICYDDIPVTANEMRAVDDLLTLKLVKEL